MPKIQRTRRVRRMLNLFTAMTMNHPSAYDQPYTTQLTRGSIGPRVF